MAIEPADTLLSVAREITDNAADIQKAIGVLRDADYTEQCARTAHNHAKNDFNRLTAHHDALVAKLDTIIKAAKP